MNGDETDMFICSNPPNGINNIIFRPNRVVMDVVDEPVIGDHVVQHDMTII